MTTEINVTRNTLDFSELHQRMQWYVDESILPCASTLTMRGLDVLDYQRIAYKVTQ